jgi:hypothetical protein
MFFESNRITRRSKFLGWFAFTGLLTVFCCFGAIAAGVSNYDGYKVLCISLGCTAAVFAAVTIGGCIYGCTTDYYNLDDLPIRIQEDTGLV